MNKLIKKFEQFYNGKPLKNQNAYATRWQMYRHQIRIFFRKSFINLAILTIICSTPSLSYYLGSKLNPNTVYADREVVKEVIVESKAPVLQRIAQCESGNKHYKNGQVIFRANSNNSVDIGKFQINSIWNATATKMGLDLTKESDNEAFAKWIYATKGTEPWYSSKACWNK